jgi:aminopeptidase N
MLTWRFYSCRRVRIRRWVLLCFVFFGPFLVLCALSALGAAAQSTHYSVKLVPDFERHVLLGDETVQFQADAGEVVWQKQAGLHIVTSNVAQGAVTVAEQSVTVRVLSAGRHDARFKFEAAEGRGIRWFEGNAGLATAFYCETWMVCDNSPGQRATLQLEIVVPFRHPSQGASGFRVVGPGRPVKEWAGDDGHHFVFEQNEPVQTYLLSFGIARLEVATNGRQSIYAQRMSANNMAFAKTADAYAFLRSAASVDPMNPSYAQAFLPGPSMGQEAAGMALMSQDDLSDLLDKDDVQLMAHELAHQWWGVTIGIQSWSDFWLNEGFAEFMSDAYIEKHQGRAAYNQKILELRERMKKLREEGKDRPLHWEKWKDAHEALGAIPYVKGALFLERLRTELGDEIFWRGIGLYTSGNALRLVDSSDFERAMEKASGRDLRTLFDEAVYH